MVKFKFCLMLSATILVGACGQTDDTSTEVSTLIANAQASDTSALPAVAKNSSEMPDVVRQWVAEKAQECRADGNKFKGISDAIKKFELSGDSITDYALWEGGLACEGRDASYFGNAGGQVSFVVSEKDGHKLHEGFSIPFWDALDVQKQSGRDTLVVSDGQREVRWGWNGKTIGIVNDAGKPTKAGLVPATLTCSGDDSDWGFQISLSAVATSGNSGSWTGLATVSQDGDNSNFPANLKASGTRTKISFSNGNISSVLLNFVPQPDDRSFWRGKSSGTNYDDMGNPDYKFTVGISCYEES